MEITARALWTVVHGMGFGALYLLACSGALVELMRVLRRPRLADTHSGKPDIDNDRFLRSYLIAMAILAWGAVLTGAYVIYPWYRAVPPAGAADLSMFPQRLLMSTPATMGWHSLGMEWKEHVAWFVPISTTMIAAVFLRYGNDLKYHRQLRAALLGFTLASFVAAGIAGFWGAMINKYAPVKGGSHIQWMRGEAR